MSYTPYKTAQEWKDQNGANASVSEKVTIDWLGALTPLTPYTPYNTGTEWQAQNGNNAPDKLKVGIDILGTQTNA